MSKSLVIVESPAKANTIHKLLGNDFMVSSSMGHIMDLPKSKMGINIEKDFKLEYHTIPSKKKIITNIKREAGLADKIFLATDPDREGEAISWHLYNLLGRKENIRRIMFHEITKTAIEEALRHPTDIDMNMVEAQQARRTLDRLVGYCISPILWRKVGRGLSAGRVQSVAVRMIVDRENEIRIFVPKEYWEIDAELEKIGAEGVSFTARLERLDGKDIEIKDREEAEDLVRELEKERFIVASIEKKEKRKYSLPPFTTSKLQQEAFYKLRFPAGKTMKIAQQLYEGLPLGEGESVGLITYMRTDSVRLSEDSINEARAYIIKKYGNDFVPAKPNLYKSKKNAQEAHEAIRPTLPLHEPVAVKEYLTTDQFRLYSLIWNRFISSQMAAAVFSIVNVEIKAGSAIFKAQGSRRVFPGFTIIYEEEGEKEKERLLPELSEGEVLGLKRLLPSQHFTKPPPRYSDASLVKALEEYGIGRPSTYAPIIQTIVTRNYVKKKDGYFYPTDLGILVTDLLIKNFPKILDFEFTAEMEEELDKIEEGRKQRIDLLKGFYGPFQETLNYAKMNMRKVKGEVVETSETCDICGKPMVIKWGRLGRFLSCSDFPRCRFAKPIPTGVSCPEPNCGGTLIERRSKKGRHFYGCSNYPKCKYMTRRLPSQEDEE